MRSNLVEDGSLNRDADERDPLLLSPSDSQVVNSSIDLKALPRDENYGDDDIDFERGSATIPLTVANMANTVVGSGIIGLPWALDIAGLGLGLILLVGVGVLTEYSLDILLIAGRLTRKYEYPDVFQHTFGRIGFVIANLTLMLNSSGGCLSYFVIIGDTVPKVLGYYVPGTILGNRQLMVLLIGVICIFPITLIRDVGKLGFVSMMSISCVVFIAIAIGVQGYTDPRYTGVPVEYSFAKADFFPAIGTMAFAYVCCQAAFILHKSMKSPTRHNWLIASSGGVGLATVMCITFATVGYCAFGSKTQANILDNFADDDVVINVARLALAVTMVFTFPFAFMVVRMACARLLYLETQEKPMSTKIFFLVSFVLFAILLTVGIFVTDLGTVYSLFGGLWSVAISYLFPAVVYLKIMHLPKFSPRSLMAWFLMIFGLVTMIVSTTSTIISLVNEGGGGDGSDGDSAPTDTPTSSPFSNFFKL